MKTYTLHDKPETQSYRKTATVELAFVTEPFLVETQEGPMTISPDTVDDWNGGYYIAYPSDGSKPFSIAPKYVLENYELVT